MRAEGQTKSLQPFPLCFLATMTCETAIELLNRRNARLRHASVIDLTFAVPGSVLGVALLLALACRSRPWAYVFRRRHRSDAKSVLEEIRFTRVLAE